MLTLPLFVLWTLAWWDLNAPGLIDPAESGDGTIVLRRLSSPNDPDEADAGPPTRVFFSSTGGPKPGGPWLGIQFGPVPKALAAQLKLDSTAGQMVMNVVEGSPADQAGLQQYDVITEIDGKTASTKIQDFMSVVQGFSPGESHSFSLVRGGDRIQSTVVIGARPEEIGPSKYKYDDEELAQAHVLGRGGMLQKDDKGNWTFKGFNMADLPDFWKAIPAPGDIDFQFNATAPFGPHSGKIQTYLKREEGKTVRIEKAGDGKITVITTINDNGKESTTTKTYDSDAELEADDPDAAKMLAEGPRMRFQFLGDGKMHIAPFDADIRLRIEDAMKNADEAIKKSGVWLDGGTGQSHSLDGKAFKFIGRQPRTSFEVTPDGKVKVTTRKGDEELTTVYDNADALKAANPELYGKFERLQQRTAKQPQD
jgi:hypothetical protein